MNRSLLLALASCAILVSNSFADDLDNQLVKLSKNNVIDGAKSFENPAEFDTAGRKVRWRTVFQTGVPCPAYESWRTKSSNRSAGQQLHLQFKKAVKLGTILAFATDSVVTTFKIRGKNIVQTEPAGIVIARTVGPVTAIDFDSVSLQGKILQNWAGRKTVQPEKLFSYQFALSGIYAIKEQRINIAPTAMAKVSGISLRRRRERAERPRNRATSLNDLSTYNYWRSNLVKPGEKAQAELSFPQAVTVREIGIYIGNYLFNEMPAKVDVTAVDSAGKSFKVGSINSFSRNIHTGKHFYLLRNPYPGRKIKKLQFNCQPLKNVVVIHEIVVLAAPEDNPGLIKKTAINFNKKITIPGDGHRYASAILLNQSGKIITHLYSSDSRNGTITLLWNGTDSSGKVVPAGNYRLNGITVGKLSALYESTPYSPVKTPWVTPSRRGGWLSDHHPAITIERLGNRLWIGAISAESGDTIMQLTMHGKKVWGVRWLNLAGAKFIRAHHNKIYTAAVGGWIGKKIRITVIDPRSKNYRTLFTLIPSKDDIVIPPHLSASQQNRYVEKSLTGFAVGDNRIALAFAATNRVELYNFHGKKLGCIAIKDPHGMRFDKQQYLFIFS